MNNATYEAGLVTQSDLRQVIEPLAGYICAAERPRAALNQAVSALFREVEQMNRVARAHVARRRATNVFPN